MEDYEGMVPPRLDQPPAPRRRGRRWLLIGGLALAFMLALGVGTLLGASNSATHAAALTTGSTTSSQSLVFAQGNVSPSQPMAGGQGMQGAQGQCESLTVSSVNGNTIVAKTASGSSVTIHTTASTSYTQAGKAAAASAIKVGTRISVMGTHNSDGSITATSIVIG
jgi:uncharacterized protein DUF5666